MVAELTSYLGRYVYNPKGMYVGTVGNVIIDLPTRRVGALLLTRTNTQLVDGGRDVAVPFRWVSASGDIVILSRFPEHVTVVEESEEEQTVTA
jgi:sporulation protein YlmC with PRC-barrel domain